MCERYRWHSRPKKSAGGIMREAQAAHKGDTYPDYIILMIILE